MPAVTAPFERIDAGAPKPASADAILVVDDIVKRFETPDGVLTALDHVSLGVAPGRIRGRDRPLRLRQVDLVQRDRRPARRLRGHGQGRGRARARPACLDRHDLPGGVDLSLAQRDRQRGVPAGDRGPAEGRALRARAAFRQAGGSRRIRAALSGRALGRHAPARVDGAHARGAAEDPADGRAVRRARRADPPPARRQGPADPAASSRRRC